MLANHMLLPHDPLRLIALLPDQVAEPDMMTLVDSLLSTPIEAVVVDLQSENGLLMLETLFEMRNGEIAVGAVLQNGVELEGLDFQVNSYSQIDATKDQWDSIRQKGELVLDQGGRHLFYKGDLETAGRISALYPALKLWAWDIKSPQAGAEYMRNGFFGLVPRLWFSEEQTMTETIVLGRAYRKLVMYNP